DYALEDVFQRFLDWVALHDDTYLLGATNSAVRAKYYAARNALTVSPRGELGAAEWTDAFLLAGYIEGDWPRTAVAFAAFVNDDDPAPITELFHAAVDTADDNSYAIYLATSCTDAHWPQRWTEWRRDNDRVAAHAPAFTWGNAWFNAPCQS